MPRGMLRRQCSQAYLMAMPCRICDVHSVMSNELGRQNQSSMYCMIVVLPIPERW